MIQKVYSRHQPGFDRRRGDTDMMNTAEGRKMAEHRQAVMQAFLDEFMAEWGCGFAISEVKGKTRR